MDTEESARCLTYCVFHFQIYWFATIVDLCTILLLTAGFLDSSIWKAEQIKDIVAYIAMEESIFIRTFIFDVCGQNLPFFGNLLSIDVCVNSFNIF